MSSILRSYLLIFTPVYAAGAFTGWVIPWWLRHWARSLTLAAETRAAADELPVPYWPADDAVQLDGIEALMATVTCTWCKPKGTGLCSCSGRCGHIRCIGRGSAWTTADQEILKGKRLP